jgi:flagellar protein FliO/FliZ
MIKWISLSRAVATATAAFGACALAFASPASAYKPALQAGGENTPLNLSGTKSTATHAATSSGGASIVRTIVGLAIVLAVIWGLAWILKQVKAGRDPHMTSAGLASVAALTLGSGRSVHLVRAGSDYVLLGSTEHGVAPIHRYTEVEARDAGLLADPDALGVPERSGLIATATQIVAGTGRALSQGGRSGQRAPAIERGSYDRGEIAGERELSSHSPAAGGWGSRPDPMRMPSPSSGLLGRLRELTVRR